MINIKRGRGRPKKYNTDLDNMLPKTRGRPKGSVNKYKNKVINNSNDSIDDETILANTVDKRGGIGTMNEGRENVDIDPSKISKTFSINEDVTSNTSKIYKKLSNIDLPQHNNTHNNSSDIIDDTIIKNTNDSINKNKINADLVMAARRQLARDSLADYACMIDIPDSPLADDDQFDEFTTIKLDTLAIHHQLMCNELQKLVDLKPSQRSFDCLMLFMPPGSAKSTYTDVVFGSWFMAKYPRKGVILASYGDEPAQNQARKVKQLINSRDHKNLFPDAILSKDRTAVDNFALTNGSSFLSRGLFGEITSRRADLGIIDDPVKGAEEADSEVMQKKTYQAYERNFTTRLKPGSPIVMIMTRWNENDLAGQILPDGWDGESGDFIGKDNRRWRVICLPAICDREDDPLSRKIGESLWPEWFGKATGNPLDHWRPFRSDPRTWASLYQQKPTAGDGIYFIRENIVRYRIEDLPNDLRHYMTSDYAVSDGKGDYTVLRVWGIDDKVDPPNIYLVDGFRGKTKSDKWIKEQCKLMYKYKPLKAYGEGGVIQKAIEPMLLEGMRNHKPTRVVCPLEWLPSTTSKEARARSAQSLTVDKRVYLPDTPEYDIVVNEYVKFPAGKNDDDVDNLSLIGRVIDKITIKRYKPVIKPIPSTATPFNRKN